MVHENDSDHNGCEFGHFFTTTPQDLIEEGLYKTIAVALHPSPHREVSLALVAQACGAKPSKSKKEGLIKSPLLRQQELEVAQFDLEEERASSHTQGHAQSAAGTEAVPHSPDDGSAADARAADLGQTPQLPVAGQLRQAPAAELQGEEGWVRSCDGGMVRVGTPAAAAVALGGVRLTRGGGEAALKSAVHAVQTAAYLDRKLTREWHVKRRKGCLCAVARTPASWDRLARLLAAPGTRNEPLSCSDSNGRLRCDPGPRPKLPSSRHATPRLKRQGLVSGRHAPIPQGMPGSLPPLKEAGTVPSSARAAGKIAAVAAAGIRKATSERDASLGSDSKLVVRSGAPPDAEVVRQVLTEHGARVRAEALAEAQAEAVAVKAEAVAEAVAMKAEAATILAGATAQAQHTESASVVKTPSWWCYSWPSRPCVQGRAALQCQSRPFCTYAHDIQVRNGDRFGCSGVNRRLCTTSHFSARRVSFGSFGVSSCHSTREWRE